VYRFLLNLKLELILPMHNLTACYQLIIDVNCHRSFICGGSTGMFIGYWHIACITTMLDRTCLVLCKPHFSLAIWLASAMASFSCLGLSVFVPLYSLFVTFTGQSNASSGLIGHLGILGVF
jgi:hypothetical protein